MSITEKGLSFIRSFEGRALRAYRDSAGVWTIGYGSTNFDAYAVKYLGRKISAGMEITDQQAEHLLRESIRRSYAPEVSKAMPTAKPHENDAGISFHYNTGAIGRATWVKQWRAKASGDAIRGSMLSWNRAGGKVLAGLTRRRAAEAQMLLYAEYGPTFSPQPGGMLKHGSSGPAVRDLHAQLTLIGYKLSGEFFDTETEKAVRAFQASHKQLKVDGIAGPATRAALNREADLRRKSANTTKAGGAVVGGVVADVASNSHLLPTPAWIAIGVVLVTVFAFVAWAYRDEVAAILKRRSN
jgi:lysozyme